MEGEKKMSFFNKIITSGENARKNILYGNSEIQKYSSAIAQCENEMESIYTEIGRRYYNAKEEITREAFGDLFEIIENKQRQIEDLQNKIQILKNVEICKVCGAEIKKESNFCAHCGARVEREQLKTEPVSAMKCWNCQTPLTGKEKFCSSCGAKIEIEEIVENVQTEVYQNIQEVQKCPVCGEELNGTETFCKSCGHFLQQE